MHFDIELGSGFGRKTAVDNAREFFCHYNVYEAASLDAELIYHGLKEYVLPAIFDFDADSVIAEYQSEDIQPRFIRHLALNEKVNAGATLDSLRADMAKKEQAVRSIERALHSCGDSDSEAKDKLNIALQFAHQELKEAADWVTTAEQVLGGTYLQDIGNLERQRRESEYLPNGLRPADDEPMPQTSGAHRRR